MKKILIVEDSKTTSATIESYIEDMIENVEVLSVGSFQECEKIIDGHKEDIILSILDLHLPDAHDGEIVDFVLSFGIPVIVMTATYDEEIKNRISGKEIIDYFVKDSINALEQIAVLVKRIINNKNIKVLIAEDSKTYRAFAVDLLKRLWLNVYEATDGKEALEIFKENPDIKIVLTDYIMPNMDGVELTRKLRRANKKDTLAIIVMSSIDNKSIPSKFLKLGANDFIYKPFSVEEFFTRLNSNLEILELFSEKRERAEKDYLTGLYNRRYFFEMSKKIVANAKRRKTKLAVAMLDIDFFKKINDSYGHDIGDRALKMLAKTLNSSFREADVVSRFGGEEFCVLLVDVDEKALFEKLDNLRIEVEHLEVKYNDAGDIFSFSISIGATAQIQESIEMMISEADRMLYEAKNSGRNRVVIGQ